MMKKISIFILFFIGLKANAITFSKAISLIENHESVNQLVNNSKSLNEQARLKGSWGDLNFKVNAKNFPVKTFNFDESPMTGVELSLLQKFPLTSKLSKFKNSYIELANSKKSSSMQKQRVLKKILWQLAINKEKVKLDTTTFKQNLSWLKRMLKISKNLYTNGKIPQQALLDIQIRIAEVETKISNQFYNLKEIDQKLSYILNGKRTPLSLKTIPWKILSKMEKNPQNDFEEKTYQKLLVSKDLEMRAQSLSKVPDLTLSAGYTFRSNLWSGGDFLSVFLNIPIPTSSASSASYKKAVYKKYETDNALRNYQINKKSTLGYLSEHIKKIKEEINILKNKTLLFAHSLRKITAKSYGLGKSTYIELLDSEIKLLNLLLRENRLNASLKNFHLERKFIAGGKLDESI